MTIDEAIAHALEMAEEKEREAKEHHQAQVNKCNIIPFATMDYTNEIYCQKCADEHRQLAEWLTDYKKIKEEKSNNPLKSFLEYMKDLYLQNKDEVDEIAKEMKLDKEEKNASSD